MGEEHCNWVMRNRDRLGTLSSIVTIISFPLVLIGLVVGYFQIRDLLIAPSIQLQFVHPASVSYYIENTSKKVIEGGYIAFALVDLDSKVPENPAFPAPVPLRSRKYDYLNRYSRVGPTSLLGNDAIIGHRYFGIIYGSCKGCSDLMTYWIYFRHGNKNEAFYSSRSNADTLDINISRLVANTDDYLNHLIPKERRIPIGN